MEWDVMGWDGFKGHTCVPLSLSPSINDGRNDTMYTHMCVMSYMDGGWDGMEYVVNKL